MVKNLNNPEMLTLIFLKSLTACSGVWHESCLRRIMNGDLQDTSQVSMHLKFFDRELISSVSHNKKIFCFPITPGAEVF